MTELVIVRGLPGCGKTAYARQWVADDRANRARVNRDDIRQMLDEGEHVKGVTEGRVLAVRDAAVVALLKRGVSVVSDDTNLPNRTVRDLMRLAKAAKADVSVHDMTDVALTVAQQQNANRTDKPPVPDDVIRDMYYRFIRGTTWPLPITEPEASTDPLVPYEDPGPGFPEAIIVDIDGTLALNGTRDPFDESRVREDLPNDPVVELVQVERFRGTRIIVMSGRTDGCRDATACWLSDHVGSDMNGDWDGQLHMRRAGDGRKDSEVKYELFNENVRGKYRVKYVLDDRDQVVDLWRSLGLTCLQVAPGDF